MKENPVPELSLVIPVYNDAGHLAATLAAARAALEAGGRRWEIIVVDDGSRDRTAAIAAAAAAAAPGLRLLRLPRNRGKGAAVRRGMLAARGRYVLFSDSDLSTPLEEIPRLLAPVAAGECDLAIASRGMPGSRVVRPQPRLRRLIGRCFPFLVRLLVTRRFRDTQCGFKLFCAPVARALFAPLRTRGFAFDVEILLRALQGGYRVCEVPVTWINCTDSRVRIWRDPWRMLRDLVRIRLFTRTRRPGASGCRPLPWLIIAGGVWLRLAGLGTRSYWCDEFLALSLGLFPGAGDLVRWVAVNDAHPPLFYLLVRLLVRPGVSEALLRLGPALAGGGAVAAFYLLLRRFWRRRPEPALLLLALAPAAVLWSQTVKSYSLLTLLGILATYFFLAWRESRRRRDLAGWLAASLAGLYLHNYGALVPAAHFAYACLRRRERPPGPALAPFLFLALLYLPHLVVLLRTQLAFVGGATHSVTDPFLRAAYTFFYLSLGATVFPRNLAVVIPGLAVFTLLTAAGFFSRRPEPLVVIARLVMLMALAAIFAVTATIPQTLVHLQPFFLLLAAAGAAGIAARVRPRAARWALACLPALCLLPGLFYYHVRDGLQYHDVSRLVPYREISRCVGRRLAPDEVVLFTENRARHFQPFVAPFAPWDWYWPGPAPLVEFNPLTAADPGPALASLLEQTGGFWLLVNRHDHQPWLDQRLLPALADLQQAGRLVKIKEVGLVRNRSFSQWLAAGEAPEYHFIEIYHFRGKD